MRKGILYIFFFWLILGCSKQNKRFVEQPSTNLSKQRVTPAPAPADQSKSNTQQEDRTDWQNPEFIIDLIGDLRGKTVADIGAGSGYFSFKLAHTAEKVIALDIDPKALDYINNQKAIVGDWSNNIETRLTPPDVPNLLEEEVDLILIVNTINYIPGKAGYLLRLLEGLKSGGNLIIIDFKKGDIPVGPADDYKTEAKEIRTLVRKAGFKSISEDSKSLKYQFILSAEKR